MALAILDGTQTATTLSTILSSGQHITAHTVVSLGTQAITDILNATSAGLTNTQLRASAVTIGGTVTVGNSVTVSSLPAISGTVTANVPVFVDGYTATTGVRVIGTGTDGTLRIQGIDPNLAIPANLEEGGRIPVFGTVTANAGDGFPAVIYSGILQYIDSEGAIPVGIGSALPAGTAQIGSVTASISNSVTIASLPAISGTVTANLSISATAITSGSFASLTSATLVPGNTARKMATVYNLGAGQLFVNAGSSATTLGGGFMVALNSGDFYECNYTTTTLSAIFATAGTASWVSH